MLHKCTEGFGQLETVGTFPHCITYGTMVKHKPNKKIRNGKRMAMHIVETEKATNMIIIIQTNT